jgi:pyruvate kinase
MINLGVDVFRLNFSHGDEAEHKGLVRMIREAAEGRPIAIMGDLSGPKIRCGRIVKEPVLLKEGASFVLTVRDVAGTAEAVSVSYKRLPEDVHPGEGIFLDDGAIELRVTRVAGKDIYCRVVNGGLLSSHKGINLPGATLSVPALTIKDRRMIRFGVAQGLDFFALSFVRRAQDIHEARCAVRTAGATLRRQSYGASVTIPILAKIEKHEAVTNIEEILEAADGAMVARGDLGIEIPLEDVPLVQKRIIALCNAHGKPVITATQMLESMMSRPSPTRAEVADIANAIIDGTDAVMLSGETAVGQYPCEAVAIMDKVAKRVEEGLDYNRFLTERSLAEAGSVPDAISLATALIARTLDVAAILCLSVTGYTARFVARYRPQCPILVFTLDADTQRRLQLTWGVVPFLMKKVCRRSDLSGFEALVREAVKVAKDEGFVRSGERVVVTAGVPLGVGGATNMLRVVEV